MNYNAVKNIITSLLIGFLAAWNRYLIFADTIDRILIFVSISIGCAMIMFQSDAVTKKRKEDD